MAIERIIGIDFGTSTSLVKVKTYKDGQPMDGDPASSQYVEFDGRDKVPTLIRFAETEEYYGYDAVAAMPDSKLCKNFKLELENPDTAAEARELTKKFFRFLYHRYSEQSTHFGRFDTERTLVSYPAKWKQETRDFMLQTARDTGFQNVEGMDEPTAALYTVLIHEEEQLQKYGLLQKGRSSYVLMIDMGAGTTDLALCRFTPEEGSQIISTWPKADSQLFFGGREVDDILMDYLCGYLEENQIAPSLIRNFSKQNMENCKAWKEDTVSKTLDRGKAVTHCSFVTTIFQMMDTVPTRFQPIDRVFMEQITATYLSKFSRLVNGSIENAKKEYPFFQGGEDIDLVILTGGHSQWYFTSDMLSGRSNFGGRIMLDKMNAEQDRIIRLIRPQESVSCGLVYSPQKIHIQEGPVPAPAPKPAESQPAKEPERQEQKIQPVPTPKAAPVTPEPPARRVVESTEPVHSAKPIPSENQSVEMKEKTVAHPLTIACGLGIGIAVLVFLLVWIGLSLNGLFGIIAGVPLGIVAGVVSHKVLNKNSKSSKGFNASVFGTEAQFGKEQNRK